MLEELYEPFALPFVQRGLLEVLALSVGAGLVGTWVVLRGLAFYSHAVGTAAFPGVVLAGGLGFAAPLGALASAVVFAGGLERLSRGRRSGYDSLTALVLVGMMALGVILASDVFFSGSDVDTLLFGSLLLIGRDDVSFAAAASVVTFFASYLFGRVWLATGFDPAAARSLGLHSAVPDAVLLLLIAVVGAAALFAVGAILVTTLLVVPAATARLFTRRLLPWQIASIALVVAEGAPGLWLSVATNTPPGATIAMLAGGVFALCLVVRRLTGEGTPPISALQPGPGVGKDRDHPRGRVNTASATVEELASGLAYWAFGTVFVHPLLRHRRASCSCCWPRSSTRC